MNEPHHVPKTFWETNMCSLKYHCSGLGKIAATGMFFSCEAPKPQNNYTTPDDEVVKTPSNPSKNHHSLLSCCSNGALLRISCPPALRSVQLEGLQDLRWLCLSVGVALSQLTHCLQL